MQAPFNGRNYPDQAFLHDDAIRHIGFLPLIHLSFPDDGHIISWQYLYVNGF